MRPLLCHLALCLLQLLDHLPLAFPSVLHLNLLLLLFFHPTLLLKCKEHIITPPTTGPLLPNLSYHLPPQDEPPFTQQKTFSSLSSHFPSADSHNPLLFLLILLPMTLRTASMSKGYDFIFLPPLPGSKWLRLLTVMSNCFGPHKPMFTKMRSLISMLRLLVFVLGSQEVEILKKAVLRIEWCEIILSIVAARSCTLFCFVFFLFLFSVFIDGKIL